MNNHAKKVVKELSKKKSAKPCVARTPLRWGSEPCPAPAMPHGDLCVAHQKLIAPHQLIDGVFYVDRGEDE